MIRFLKIFIYLIIFCVDIFAMNFFHSYELFIIAVVLVIFPLIIEALFFIGASKIKVIINSEKYEITKGDKLNINFVLKNYFVIGYLHLTCKIGSIYYDNFETDKTETLLFFGNKIKFPIVFDNVGRYTISAKNIYVSDFFGIFNKKIQDNYSINIIVMPKVGKSINFISGDTEIDSNWAINNYSANYGDISGIREYIAGDRLNCVHWKISGRKDEIMVKEFEKAGSEEYIILFDFSNEFLDLSFDNFYTISNELINKNKSFYVMWLVRGNEDLSISHITNKKDLKRLMSALFVSYPVYKEASVKNAFKRQFPNSRGIYAGRVEELI